MFVNIFGIFNIKNYLNIQAYVSEKFNEKKILQC